MPKVGIVTDSTCDIEPSQLADVGVEMVPLTVHFADEHFRDWIDLRPGEFDEAFAAALDGRGEGFAVVVVEDGCRAVNLAPDDGPRALAEMAAAGCRIAKSNEA